MKKIFFLSLIVTNLLQAQSLQNLGLVGINTSEPLSLLDIRPKDNIATINTGFLTTSINNFPAADPTIEQNGMLINYTGNNLNNGLYYWDNTLSRWQYIFQNSTIKNNLSKISFVANVGFASIENSTDTSWKKTSFSEIKTPDNNFKINADGDIVIGEDGNYNLFFTGGITQESSTGSVANFQIVISKKTGQNAETELKTSYISIPAADFGERSSNAIISMNVLLLKNDIIKVQTRRTSTVIETKSKPSTKYAIILSKLSNS